MQALNSKNMRTCAVVTLALITLLLTGSCNKEKRTIYQVQEQQVYQNNAQKGTLKTTTQFISIAYNDLFNAAITTQELNQLSLALQSFGDKSLIEDMIVKNLLKKGENQIPANGDMRQNISGFVTQTYLRFYNRQPTDFELWKMQQLIQQNTDITPEMIYYSVMTSEEYKYY